MFLSHLHTCLLNVGNESALRFLRKGSLMPDPNTEALLQTVVDAIDDADNDSALLDGKHYTAERWEEARSAVCALAARLSQAEEANKSLLQHRATIQGVIRRAERAEDALRQLRTKFGQAIDFINVALAASSAGEPDD